MNTIHVAQIGLSGADDPEILQRAYEEQRVVVTLDADFHALLALSGAKSPSVIRIRIEGVRAPELVSLVLQVIGQSDEDLKRGAVVTVQRGRLRSRRLPLLGN
jgi:predicted nuclease of predicted toxin-antitoxin system